RVVTGHAEAALRVDRAGAEVGARSGRGNLADVGRAEVEIGLRADEPDRVEIAIVEHLDAHDRAALGVDELLDEHGAVRAEVERRRPGLEIGARIEPLDERARAADVLLYQERKAQLAARLEYLIAMIHDDGPRIIHAQALEEPDLQRLGLLEPVRVDGMDHGNAEGLPVRQERLGVEQNAAVTAPVRGGARAIDDDGVPRDPVARVEGVVRVIDLLERKPAMLELGDEPGRPLRMLVEDADGSGEANTHWGISMST